MPPELQSGNGMYQSQGRGMAMAGQGMYQAGHFQGARLIQAGSGYVSAPVHNVGMPPNARIVAPLEHLNSNNQVSEAGMGTASAGRAQEVEENIVQDFLRVCLKIIRNARLENVGKYQSCMVSKLRIIWKQTEAKTEKSIGRRADDDGGGGGGMLRATATAIGGHEQLAQLEKRLLRQMERQHAQLTDRIDKLLSLQQQQCGALKQHATVDVGVRTTSFGESYQYSG